MSLRADRREWNDLAQEDGMWAVHSDPQRRGSWTPDDFFATGEQEIASAMKALEEHGLLPPRAIRALDFGCGLGRLTRALSSRFEEVVGVDTSQKMIDDATRLNADRDNCRFVLNERSDLEQLPSGSFDFVLSFITLQHVSSRAAIRAYVREFVRVTAPGGVVVFQLPTAIGWQIRMHPLRLLNRALRTLPRPPRWALRRVMGHSMRLVGLPEQEVRGILSSSGAPVVLAVSDNRTGSKAAPSLTYVARRAATAAS
jgi:SAM-dependent methyltransferase